MVLTRDDIKSLLMASPPLIEGLVDADKQIQPNGVDLSLSSISRFQGEGAIDFSGKETVLPSTAPIDFDSNGWITLSPGCYLITFNEVVNLPVDIMAIGRPRSSILRMGATVETAVWDAGYRGTSQSLFIVLNENGVKVSMNARIMQLVFTRLSKETDGYKGVYQEEST